MSNDDPTALSALLLQQAGLRDFADILREQPSALGQRLEAACRSLDLSPGLSGEEWVNHLIALARRRGPGEITAEALLAVDSAAPKSGVATRQPPADSTFGIGLAGREDFDPWGRGEDETIAERGLPGKEDFDPWRRKGDRDL
jgi:hypothetical protein